MMSEYNININKTNEQKKSEKITDFINVLQYSSSSFKEEIKEEIKKEIKKEIKEEIKMTDFIDVLQYSSLVKKKDKKDKKDTSTDDYSSLFKKGSINYNSLI